MPGQGSHVRDRRLDGVRGCLPPRRIHLRTDGRAGTGVRVAAALRGPAPGTQAPGAPGTGGSVPPPSGEEPPGPT